MQQFLNIVTHYPVAIFSVFLLVAVFYWLIAMLGFVDMDAGVDVDADLDLDIDLDLDLDAPGPDVPMGGAEAGDGVDVDGSGMSGTIAGLLLKLGLNGVPLPLVVTLIALLGWLLSYFGTLICFSYFHVGILRWVLGTVVLIVAFVLGVYLTSVFIRPVRNLVLKNRREAVTSRSLVGRSVTIRSSVGPNIGQAACFDGGSEHILLVKVHNADKSYKHGDKAVLLEYFPDTNTYSVISEDEFRGLSL